MLTKPHYFHIPVMGTGFSIDTPLRVAKYGISSVVSLGDDILMEQMRKWHSEEQNIEFEEIPERSEDSRARRITAYLELLNKIVEKQVVELQASAFEDGSEITRYFDMLPDSSQLKNDYKEMLATTDDAKRTTLQSALRKRAVPGKIEVNIMTKLDRDLYENGVKFPPEFAVAMSALRGFANSSLDSSLVFSAGINPRLYSYITKFDDFYPDKTGYLKKKIVLKVSDFRSAKIQGKFMAKRGIWISEYRIESGLNCGGHAFATDGLLMGPILLEFQKNKKALAEELHTIYNRALVKAGRDEMSDIHDISITTQGGVGTAEESKMLVEHFDISSVGWGTPFLLVPEVTNVDDAHLEKLSSASGDDVYLSSHSPLGVPFWSLRDSLSDLMRKRKIEKGRPGSQCPKGFLVSNTEFTEIPICRASRKYQKLKLRQLEKDLDNPQMLAKETEKVIAKACICHDLAGGATLKHGIDAAALPAVCCGPNIVNFSKIATLEEMISHIYGRISLLTNSDRPHMFVRELMLNVEMLREELDKATESIATKTTKRFHEFKKNLLNGIDYYRELVEEVSLEQKDRFIKDLDKLMVEIEELLQSGDENIAIQGIV